MHQKLTAWIIKHPILVILLTLLLVVTATYGARLLVFESDYRVFFGSDNPQLNAYESIQKIYNKSDNVAFIIAPQDGRIFTRERLEAIRALTEESWQIPFSTRVDSITNYQYSYADGDDLIVEDLALEPLAMDQAALERARRIAINEPLLRNKLISPDGHVTIVNTTVQLPGVNPVEEIPQVATKVRELRDQFLARNPGVTVHLSGMVMMNNSFAEASLADSTTLVPLMFLIVALTIGLLLRTITGTLSTLLVVLFSIAVTMGIAGWTGFYLTAPSASAPTMILTLAVADCIHILTTLFYEMRNGVEKRQAILDSLRINYQPIFLTSITTAIGFLSMNFSDSPPFRDLGNLVAIGVMLAFLFSVTLFPALLALLPLKVKPHKARGDLMMHFADFVVHNRRWLLPVTSLIMIAFMLFLPQNRLNDDFVKYFDTTVPFRQATDFMQENISGMATMEISLDSGTSGGINDPVFLQKLDQLSQWLRDQPETDHVNTLSDTLKRLSRNMHGDRDDWYRLPDSRELAAQYLLLYEMSLPYGLDLNNQLNVDKSSTRLVATFNNMTSNEQIQLEQRVRDWLASHAPDYTATIASPALMFAHISQRNIRSMLLGVTLALILISLLLGVALRSLKFGLISLLPNLTPAAVGFGAWYFINGQVGLALSVVAGMTLGIVVDDTVHFLSKYLRARRERNADAHAAVRYAFSSVGRALWITTLVLVGGFLVLAQSSFKVNADMGLLTALTILIALAIDFLFLPPLLMLLDHHSTHGTDKERENTHVT
ncbi:efflux RND transporter permease subunit [Sedimenticola thiotaurini]|uniref:RND transporter n=1 Tax=Sedimenticola thiotaurini TaxID=1543721 RepID=A0A0F7JTX1_9GAMM|nr:efflux RND transporter permease subunit [Sedimenticola thiotaurini]AKH19087.1 RND transporter [Sedimenticola thiotaurini]